MKKRFVVLLLTISMLLLCGCAAYITDSRVVFGTDIEMRVKLRGKNAAKAMDEMFAAVAEINAEVSLSVQSSRLSYLNEQAAAGERVRISRHTYNILAGALELYEQTDGAFSIAVSRLSKLWNVDIEGLKNYGGYEKQPESLPDIKSVKDTKALCGLSALKLYDTDEGLYVAKESPALKIDVGGIAKGYAADVCAEIAKKWGVDSALLDISGNLMLLGSKYKGSQPQKWDIGVANPRPRGRLLPDYVMAIKTFGDVSAVTSGDYVRWYAFGKYDPLFIPHIIDPRSGLPVGIQYDEGKGVYANKADFVVSATVIGPSSMTADALATAVCVLGIEQGRALIERMGYRGIILTEDKRICIVGEIEIMDDEEFGGYKSYRPLR